MGAVDSVVWVWGKDQPPGLRPAVCSELIHRSKQIDNFSVLSYAVLTGQKGGVMTDKKTITLKGSDDQRTFTDDGIQVVLVGSLGSYVVDFTNTHPTLKLVVVRSAVKTLEIAPGETKRNYWDRTEQWRRYAYWHEAGPVVEVAPDVYGGPLD